MQAIYEKLEGYTKSCKGISRYMHLHPVKFSFWEAEGIFMIKLAHFEYVIIAVYLVFVLLLGL
ncbi:MAG: hypothetical protein K8R28_05480, partial [Desulfobacterales bacterium]|nr:hypothetical protein [Desulfobacterales bacterium]